MPTVFSTVYLGNKIYYARVYDKKGNKTVLATEIKIIKKRSLFTLLKPKKTILLAGFTKSYDGIFRFDKEERSYWIKCFDNFIKEKNKFKK